MGSRGENDESASIGLFFVGYGMLETEIMIKRIRKWVAVEYKELLNRKKSKGKVKYFCVGANKTGTTSLEKAFEDLGYPIGNQRKAELLMAKHYFDNQFSEIVNYCESAQVFQDAPFSFPDTYKYLDSAYPGSKFILTVRDDAEQWYRSITRFHAKLFGKDGRIPTASDLKAAKYAKEGFMYDLMKVYGAPDEDIYNKDILMSHYNKYNEEIVEYFKDRPDDLLVINVADKGAYAKFVDFIGAESSFEDFPWENRT